MKNILILFFISFWISSCSTKVYLESLGKSYCSQGCFPRKYKIKNDIGEIEERFICECLENN